MKLNKYVIGIETGMIILIIIETVEISSTITDGVLVEQM